MDLVIPNDDSYKKLSMTCKIDSDNKVSNPPEIVVAQSDAVFKMGLHAGISNGGLVLPISHGYGIKLIAINDKFIKIQVIKTQIGGVVKSQSWIKSVGVKNKGNTKKNKFDKQIDDGKAEEVIEVEEV